MKCGIHFLPDSNASETVINKFIINKQINSEVSYFMVRMVLRSMAMPHIGAFQDRPTKKCKLTRHQRRFCSYLAHIMCIAPIHVVKNIDILGSTSNSLVALKVLAKYLKGL